MTTFEDYRRYDATRLAKLVASGEVSAGELLDCALSRSVRGGAGLNRRS